MTKRGTSDEPAMPVKRVHLSKERSGPKKPGSLDSFPN